MWKVGESMIVYIIEKKLYFLSCLVNKRKQKEKILYVKKIFSLFKKGQKLQKNIYYNHPQGFG